MRLERFSQITAASDAAESVLAAEAAGYDSWFTGEAGFDVFIASALAAQASREITIGTAIAVAFSRTPMTVAYAAHDLMALSGGRFVLGLGSQVKAHIERRFAMPWSRPAARMREFVAAVRAILGAWETDSPLSFEGEFYSHTLMSPFFAAAPHGHGLPPIAIAAVGPKMTAVAGELADILLAHPFTTLSFLRDRTVPALKEGASRAGRDLAEIEISAQAFVVTGRSAEEMARVRRKTCQQLAFYASTPAYAAVLETIGYEALQPELQALSKEGRWREMASLIDDDFLAQFAVVTEDPDDAGRLVAERFAGLADRVGVYPTWRPDQPAEAALREAIRPAPTPGSRP